MDSKTKVKGVLFSKMKGIFKNKKFKITPHNKMNTNINVHNLPIENETLIKDVIYVTLNGFKKLYNHYNIDLNQNMIKNKIKAKLIALLSILCFNFKNTYFEYFEKWWRK